MITPPCDSPGCKNPSVHRMPPEDWWPEGLGPTPLIAMWLGSWFKHYCPACYERKVWGK